MRFIKSPLMSLFALVAIVSLVAITIARPGASSAHQQPATPKVIITYPAGIPAIVPLVKVTAKSDSGSPAFTVTDVKNYVAEHGFPGGPVIHGSSPTVVKVLFITARQASMVMHGESIGRPDNALVCYVLLRGPFDTSYISVPITTQQTPTTRKPELFGEMLFDAQTGNLLVWGLPPQ